MGAVVSLRREQKYLSGDLIVAPGGWCCWCHCHVSSVMSTEDEEE